MIYLDTFTFPSLPERIGISGGAVYQTYSLLAGRASIPGGKDIKSVKWSGTFFGRKRRRTVLVQQWEEPAECIRFLEDAMKSGKILNLIVDEAPINLDVTISTLSYEAVGAYGDIEYTIELEEASALKVYTVSEKNIQPLAKTVETRPETRASQAYTVVSGDNLWKIARRFYGGSGSDWKKIYDANAATIEETAKQHRKASSDNGHWIYPGCILTIP
ncbi:MAG: LysM peptidoglycan-binding domain-containing protein [Lachnospiraceae bacterium]|nr:LysM peptidoglycan-binding domain-containing protein [Lachnospiraceae bacterium]